MKNLLRISWAIGLAGWLMAGLSCAGRKPAESVTSRRDQFVNSTPDERAERLTRQMTRQLSLSVSQASAVAAVNLTFARRMQPMIDVGTRDRTSLQQLRQINQDKETDLKAILDARQYEQYRAMQANRQNRIRQGRPVRRIGGR